VNSPTPSSPPPLVRQSMPIISMRLKPMPARDLWTEARLKAILRKRPLPKRRAA